MDRDHVVECFPVSIVRIDCHACQNVIDAFHWYFRPIGVDFLHLVILEARDAVTDVQVGLNPFEM